MFDDFDTQIQIDDYELGIEWAERFDLALEDEERFDLGPAYIAE